MTGHLWSDIIHFKFRLHWRWYRQELSTLDPGTPW